MLGTHRLVLDTLARALDGERLSAQDGQVLMRAQGSDLSAVCAAAARLNDQARPERRVTYSRKVFLPLTNLCRDRCGYCTFVKDPRQRGAHTMTPDEVLAVAHEGARLGCKEALFSLGDHPELRHPEMQDQLRALGYSSTPEYLAAMCRLVLEETGLLPHSNCGLLDRNELASVSPYNASMGIMLESVSERLFEVGGAHYQAVTKVPQRRLEMLETAADFGIAMTTGILIGIGERPDERVDALLAIRDVQERCGNVQEVIVQNFRSKPKTRMAEASEPSTLDMLRTLAVARLLLGSGMNIQAPPNLNADCQVYLLAGINDWGGVSPLTKDFINPEAAWPELRALKVVCDEAGYALHERLALYPEFIAERRARLSPQIAARIAELTTDDGRVREELETW
jgi:FO synthase